MNFSSLIRSRLAKLGYGQKDLARAAQVTDSYVSQLLGDKKTPPDPDRTDIYSRMETFLEFAPGELRRLAEAERAEELKRRLGQTPEPLFQRFRDLVLRKCVPDRRGQVRAIFEAQPFGTLERLVARKMLEVVQRIARKELADENWMRLAALVGGRSNEAMRVMVLEFLDADVFHVSDENCDAFLDPLVASWDIDLETLRIEILLDRTLGADRQRTFALVEGGPSASSHEERALADFLRDPQLNDGATDEEVGLLRRHRCGGRRPNKLYFYRALQNLRDPLHFSEGVRVAPETQR